RKLSEAFEHPRRRSAVRPAGRIDEVLERQFADRDSKLDVPDFRGQVLRPRNGTGEPRRNEGSDRKQYSPHNRQFSVALNMPRQGAIAKRIAPRAADYAAFPTGPAKGRTRWPIRPPGCSLSPLAGREYPPQSPNTATIALG